jgi:hypothetical protein
MGIVGSLLSLIGCASSKSGPPALSDYETVLHRNTSLRVADDSAASGRYEIAAGDHAVLTLHVVRGKSLIAKDTSSDWSVAIELPSIPDGGVDVTLGEAPLCARVAGEDVLFFSRSARGTVHLDAPSGAKVAARVDVTFESPQRDLLRLGTLPLQGSLSARIE